MVAGPQVSPEVEALIWAGVHGLASLLLDGSLGAGLDSLQERLDFARRVTHANLGPLLVLADGEVSNQG